MAWLTWTTYQLLSCTCTSSHAHLVICSTPAYQMLITIADKQLTTSLRYSKSHSWILMEGCYKKGREREIETRPYNKKKSYDRRNQSNKGNHGQKFSPWKCLWFSWWWWHSFCTLAQQEVLQVGLSVIVMDVSNFLPCFEMMLWKRKDRINTSTKWKNWRKNEHLKAESSCGRRKNK